MEKKIFTEKKNDSNTQILNQQKHKRRQKTKYLLYVCMEKSETNPVSVFQYYKWMCMRF